MGKKISIILSLVFIILLIFIESDTWQQSSSNVLYSCVLSTDGYIYPGQKQDFIISLFKTVEEETTLESKANIALKIILPLRGNLKRETIIPLSCSLPGKYLCSYEFPENLDYSEVELILFQYYRKDKPIMTCKIPVKKEKAIVIQPPAKQVYTGEKVSFKLAAIDKKTGLSQFKIPIRVRVIPPSGYTTINRVVTSDTDGLATFETKIHSASPEGYYNFIFQSETFEQKITLYIKSNNINKLSNDLSAIYANDSESVDNKGYIFNLNCERNDVLLAYGCPESDFRQIEIWQNGKLHYFSNLPLEGGIISLPLNKPLLAGCPALFKVWQITDNKVSTHEKVRYIPPNNPNNAGLFLTKVNSEFCNTEKDKLAISLARKGFIGVSSNLQSENLTKVLSLDLKAVNTTPLNETALSYYDNLLKKNDNVKPEYIFVENKFKFENATSCEIFLDSNSFLESYIENLSSKEVSLNNLLQESICRIDRFEFLSLQKQKEEIENIESILTPISEIYAYLNKFPEKKKSIAPTILSCINRMKNIVFVPAEFTFDLSQNSYNTNILPMLEISPYPRSFQSIQGTLKTTGEIKLSNNQASTIINLDQPHIIIPLKDYDNLENLRSLPILIKQN